MRGGSARPPAGGWASQCPPTPLPGVAPGAVASARLVPGKQRATCGWWRLSRDEDSCSWDSTPIALDFPASLLLSSNQVSTILFLVLENPNGTPSFGCSLFL